MTFRSRLVLAATVAVVVAVLLASLAAYFATKNSLVDSLDASLTQTHNALNAQSEQGTSLPQNFRYVYGDSIQFVYPSGQVYPQNAGIPVSNQVRAVASRRAPSYFSNVTIDGQPWRQLVYPGYVRQTSPFGTTPYTPGAIQLATPLAGVNDQLRNLRLLLLVVALCGILLAVILGWLVARTALVPLNELTSAVEEVAETTDVSRRLDPGGPDELGRLRRAFNRLLGALEGSREAQRKLVLDAAHELRTPLTSLRTNMEVARRLDELPVGDRQVLTDDVITQMDELTDLVSGLTELARGDQRQEPSVPLQLDLLVADAVGLATVHGRARGLRFDLTSQETWVVGQRERITRAVGNLLDNAVKWSPEGGVIAVSCAEGTVTVRDHGPGIPEGDLPHIFDRFYRAPTARALPGSGLGLAIVAQVATEEGGTVTAANAPDGGAIFRFQLPVTAARDQSSGHVPEIG